MPSHQGWNRPKAALGLGLGLTLGLAACSGSTTPAARPHAARSGSAARAPAATVLTTSTAPWQLPAALSRAVALPDGSGVVIAGGLAADQQSASGIFRLDPATGKLTPAGSLATAVHDAAGAVMGGRMVIFGGGAQSTVATVQAFQPGQSATVTGQLPQPRSDLTATTVGGTAYIAGGYDGTSTLADVLRTTDGSHFSVLGQLPLSVRYPALAAAHGALWVFGGEHGGVPTDDIQRVDLSSGAAAIAGRLPQPLSHAAALTLDGTVLIAGGRQGSTETAQVLRFDPRHVTATVAGQLPGPVSDTAATVVGSTGYLIGGENPSPIDTVSELRFTEASPAGAGSPTVAPAAAAYPFAGRLLIADRGNNRLLLVDAAKHVVWRYPSASAPAPPGGFYFPDDAFFAVHGTRIISNEEDNNAIVRIGFPSGALLWSYGHPKVPGSAPGYLNQPDDAYLLANGDVTVADAKNCRILFITPQGSPRNQIGTTGVCRHDPPRAVGYPNGDTPLANGDVLVSEIDGSWVTEYSPTGQLRWTVQLPISYPSDPQQLGPDLYLIADYARPGGIYEFDRAGHIRWSYHPASGPGMLDHPSLAEQLPNGLIGANDDYRHRVVIIDPHTGAIVWQYGVNDTPGTAPGLLNTPDGFDLLAADGTTPTHPQTG